MRTKGILLFILYIVCSLFPSESVANYSTEILRANAKSHETSLTTEKRVQLVHYMAAKNIDENTVSPHTGATSAKNTCPYGATSPTPSPAIATYRAAFKSHRSTASSTKKHAQKSPSSPIPRCSTFTRRQSSSNVFSSTVDATSHHSSSSSPKWCLSSTPSSCTSPTTRGHKRSASNRKRSSVSLPLSRRKTSSFCMRWSRE